MFNLKFFYRNYLSKIYLTMRNADRGPSSRASVYLWNSVCFNIALAPLEIMSQQLIFCFKQQALCQVLFMWRFMSDYQFIYLFVFLRGECSPKINLIIKFSADISQKSHFQPSKEARLKKTIEFWFTWVIDKVHLAQGCKVFSRRQTGHF